jgi:hypothetical protein
MRERDVYTMLKWINWYRAASRGPDALVRRFIRIQLYKMVDRAVGRSPRRRWR